MYKLLAYTSYCELLSFAVWGPTGLCFLISFSKQVLYSYVAVSDLVFIGSGSRFLRWGDGYVSRLQFGTDLWPCRLWLSWIFCSYTVNDFQHSGAVRAASGSKQCLSHTEKSWLFSSPLIAHLSQYFNHNIHQATEVTMTANSFPVNL